MKNFFESLEKFNESHPKAKKVYMGMAYIFSEKMLKFAIGFLVHALVARHLGPDDFGKLSYIIKTVNIFYVFSLFGVDEIVMKYFLDTKYDSKDVLKTILGLRLLMSLIGLVLLISMVLIFRPEGKNFTLFTILYGVQIIIQSFNLFELEFQSRMAFKPLFWAHNISNLFASGLRVLGVYSKLGLPFFLSTYVLGELLLKFIVQWRSGFKVLKGKLLPDVARTLSRTSIPHFLSAFILLADQRVSFFFIEEYLKDEALGNYSVAVTLVDLCNFLPLAISAALFPTIVNAFNDNRKAYESRIEYLSGVLIWIGIGFAFCVFVTADLVIEILYGKKFGDAPEIIRWYSLVTIPIFFNIARVKWMSLENHLYDWLKLTLVSFIINIVFHSQFVPHYGVKGAIWSFLLAQVSGLLFGAVVLKSGRKSAFIFIKSLILPFKMIRKVL